MMSNSSAAEPHQPLLTEAQRQELQRRIAADDADPDDVVPWEQVKAQTLSRLKPCAIGKSSISR